VKLILLRLATKGIAALAFEVNAKDNPAILIKLLWSSVRCMCPKSPDCGICFNDSCAALQKKNKVDQLRNPKLKSNAIATLIIWCFGTRNTLIQNERQRNLHLYEPCFKTDKEEDWKPCKR
jgi:hypothetical protein